MLLAHVYLAASELVYCFLSEPPRVTRFCNLLYSSVRLSYSRIRLSDCDFIASLSLRSLTNSAFRSANFFFNSPIFNQSYCLKFRSNID